MYQLSPDQFIRVLIVASVIALIPAKIAYSKGRNFVWWWLYGVMLFIVALFHSLLLEPRVPSPVAAQPSREPRPPALPEGTKKCVHCDQLIDELASRCPVCKGEQPAGARLPPPLNAAN
jgi:hypothetical protein